MNANQQPKMMSDTESRMGVMDVVQILSVVVLVLLGAVLKDLLVLTLAIAATLLAIMVDLKTLKE